MDARWEYAAQLTLSIFNFQSFGRHRQNGNYGDFFRLDFHRKEPPPNTSSQQQHQKHLKFVDAGADERRTFFDGHAGGGWVLDMASPSAI